MLGLGNSPFVLALTLHWPVVVISFSLAFYVGFRKLGGTAAVGSVAAIVISGILASMVYGEWVHGLQGVDIIIYAFLFWPLTVVVFGAFFLGALTSKVIAR